MKNAIFWDVTPYGSCKNHPADVGDTCPETSSFTSHTVSHTLRRHYSVSIMIRTIPALFNRAYGVYRLNKS